MLLMLGIALPAFHTLPYQHALKIAVLRSSALPFYFLGAAWTPGTEFSCCLR